MIMKTEDREAWITKFKAFIVFIEPIPTPAEIDKALDKALLEVSEKCKKRWEILESLTIHYILSSRVEIERTEEGDVADLKEIQRVGMVGDVSTTFFKGNSDSFNPDYNSTFWGAKAKRMMDSCKKARIGLIY